MPSSLVVIWPSMGLELGGGGWWGRGTIAVFVLGVVLAGRMICANFGGVETYEEGEGFLEFGHLLFGQ